MPYKYRVGISKDRTQRHHKRAIRFLGALLFCVVAAIAIFLWYISRAETYQPQSDATTASFQPLKTFNTRYFSFETDKTWKFITTESTDKIFVYRSSKNNIVMRDLRVYVDSLPANLLLTHVLPVEPEGDRFGVGEVSSHCKDYLKRSIKPGNNNPINGTVKSVKITCQIDGTSNTVGTGKKHGSYRVSLAGPDGPHDYYLLFHDLQFTPRLDEFTRIAQSFRAK